MIKLEIDITKLDLQGLKEAQAIIDAVLICRMNDEIPGPDYGDETEEGTEALTEHLASIPKADTLQLQVDGAGNESWVVEEAPVVEKPKRSRKAKAELIETPLIPPLPSYSVAIPEVPPVPLPDAAPTPSFPNVTILSTDLVNLMIDSEKAGKITQIDLLEIVQSVGLEAVRDVCLTTPEKVAKIWGLVTAKVGM